MAKIAKKVTRKQLLKQEDEFLTTSGRLLRYIVENKVYVFSGLGIFFALIIIFSGLKYLAVKSENKALTMLGEGIKLYETTIKDNTAESAYNKVSGHFSQILDEYASKEGGKLSRVIFANICYNAGKVDQAIELYQRALDDFNEAPSVRNLILSGLGYCYESKKEYKKAIGYFDMIVSGNDKLIKAEAFYHLGKLYSETGDAEKSKQAYNKITSEFADSIYNDMVKEKLAG